MKKTVAILAAILMGLTACADDNGSQGDDAVDSTVEETTVSETTSNAGNTVERTVRDGERTSIERTTEETLPSTGGVR